MENTEPNSYCCNAPVVKKGRYGGLIKRAYCKKCDRVQQNINRWLNIEGALHDLEAGKADVPETLALIKKHLS